MTKFKTILDAAHKEDPKGTREYAQKEWKLEMGITVSKEHKYDNHDIEVLTSTTA